MRCAVLGLAAVVLAGCGGGGLFGGGEDEEKLPGERISVLNLESKLEPSDAIADRRIRLPKPYVNESWSQPGGGPTHAMYHLALPAELNRAWEADIGDDSGDRAQILAQPVVAEGRVFTLDARSTVSAFDAADGTLLWRSDLAPEEDDEGFFGGGLAFADGRLFVTTGFAAVYALEAGSGKILWRHSAGAPLRAGPSVRDGQVFAVTVANETLALSATDGRVLWSHQGIEEEAGLLGSASPAAGESGVVSAYSSGEVFALLRDNGRVLWNDSLAGFTRTSSVADMADIRGLPVIDRDRVIAASNANRAVAIDLRRGTRIWEAEIGSIEMPWAGGDYIFVVTTDNQLVALDREGGRIRWVTRLQRFTDPEDRTGPIHWQGPVLAGDRLLLAGTHGQAISVSPYTGQVLGAIELPDSAAVSPVVADNTVYFLTDDATLTAYR